MLSTTMRLKFEEEGMNKFGFLCSPLLSNTFTLFSSLPPLCFFSSFSLFFSSPFFSFILFTLFLPGDREIAWPSLT